MIDYEPYEYSNHRDEEDDYYQNVEAWQKAWTKMQRRHDIVRLITRQLTKIIRRVK